MRIRQRNWLGESKRAEIERRLAAVEASVAEAHLRANKLELMIMAHIGDAVESVPEE